MNGDANDIEKKLRRRSKAPLASMSELRLSLAPSININNLQDLQES